MEFESLIRYMDQATQDYGLPGWDVSVYSHKRPVFRRSLGFSDSTKTHPVGPEDIYTIYSATKVLTNTALARLVQEGKLALEDEVDRYLPAFGAMKVRQGDRLVPAQRKITLRDLTTMCAGMDYDLNAPAIREAVARYGKEATTRQLVDAMARSPLSFQPGAHFQYSLCHDVLAAVIEVVTGMDFGAYLGRLIFEPLGMANTTFHPTAEQRKRLTAQYSYDAQSGAITEMPNENEFILSDRFESGGAGLYTTVDDYMRFAVTLAGGGTSPQGYELLKPESVERMRTPMLNETCLRDFKLFGKKGYSYGMGVRVMVDPETYGFCTGKGEFGWDGAACAYVSIQPDHELAIFIGMQIRGFTPAYDEIHPQIREFVYKELNL